MLNPTDPSPAPSGLPAAGLLSRSWAAVRRRFVAGRRRGSVLILVVALLVLLALIGTAFITSAGADRDATVQHGYNTQVGLLVDGVIQMLQSAVLNDVAPSDPPADPSVSPSPVVSKGAFRPATPVKEIAGAWAVPGQTTVIGVPKYYANVDFTAWDAFLADRYPDLPTAGGAPEWRYVTASPLAGTRQINDPLISSPSPNLFASQFKGPYVNGSVGSAEIHTRFRLAPTYIDVPTPTGIKRRHPAFLVNDNQDANFGKVVLAADADGDGIADAGLFELPIGQINGVKYYAAVRIIDNSAALNVSTAWQNLPAAGTFPAGVTPAGIELKALLDPNDPTNATTNTGFDPFNQYRWGGLSAPSLTPDPSYSFASQHDAFWFMLGSRLDNPAIATGTTPYRAPGLSDSVALAYRFCLPSTAGAGSVFEQYFPNSTGVVSTSFFTRTQPYSPDDVTNWFTSIFNYNAGGTLPIRPLVVGHNAVSNFVPSFVERVDNGGNDLVLGFNPISDATSIARQRNGQYRYRGTWDLARVTPPLIKDIKFQIGDWVHFTDPATGLLRAYVCCQNHTNIPPVGAPNSLSVWAVAPWKTSPVKISLNTASYGQLMAAYNGVMADGPEIKPTLNSNQDPGYGNAAADTPVWTFGPVGRYLGSAATKEVSVPITAVQVKQLRAALAAVNTIDLRDSDNNVTSRTVMLTQLDGSGGVKAQVYGTEMQPYLTEVLVHITPLNKAYVCVELFNPYPVALKLDAFRLAYRNRDAGGAMVVVPTATAMAGQVIQPYGYAYLENTADPMIRPTDCAPPGTPIEAPTLGVIVEGSGGAGSEAGQCELVLQRTRRYDGVPTANADPANTFDEITYVENWVPVDQLDFTGIATGSSNAGGSGLNKIPVNARFHYRRATWDPAAPNPALNPPWNCVYAGPYKRNVATGERRPQGFVKDPLPPDAMSVAGLTLAGWGVKTRLTGPLAKQDDFAGDVHASTYVTRTVQINSYGMPGPYKINTQNAAPPAFPWGGFARTGDALCVPFIGGYLLGDRAGVYELNAVSVDAALAEDGDKDDDVDDTVSDRTPLEQLGRFCPLYEPTAVAPKVKYDDLSDKPDPVAPAKFPLQRYAWAADLFDYVTVTSPQDDYRPDVDPGSVLNNAADPTIATVDNGADATTTGGNPQKWPLNGGSRSSPVNVANGPLITEAGKANRGQEDAAATHGLININTANWKVIAQIPFTNTAAKNEQVARMIVAHRDQYGPFKNLFELQKVGLVALSNPPPSPIVFRDAMGVPNDMNPLETDGDISPFSGNVPAPVYGDDQVKGDFEARYLVLNRVSNLISFRSDSFTAYVLVQGWRNAGTGAPELVVQRRAALVVDRSTAVPKVGVGALTASGDQDLTPMTPTNIPNN